MHELVGLGQASILLVIGELGRVRNFHGSGLVRSQKMDPWPSLRIKLVQDKTPCIITKAGNSTRYDTSQDGDGMVIYERMGMTE